MGNGMVERYSQTLLNMMKALKKSQKIDRNTFVPLLMHAYMTAMHESTGFSPFSCLVAIPVSPLMPF